MAVSVFALFASLFLSFPSAAATLQCDKLHPDAEAMKGVSRAGKPLKPVFIYINNDFAVNPGFDSAYQGFLDLLGKIRSSKASSLSDAAKQHLAAAAAVLQKDLNTRTSQADKQMRDLEQFGCGDKNRFGNGLVLISNHGARTPVKDNTYINSVDLTLTYCKPNKEGTGFEHGTSPIEFAYSDHIFKEKKLELDLLVSQLLLMPHMVDYGFERVLKLFPSDEYNYYVWVRGLGDATHVTLPFLNADYSAVPADQIWNVILATQPDMAKTSEASQAFRTALEESFAPNVFSNRYMEKMAFLEILQKYNSINKAMMFPYVVLNTDESSLTNGAPDWLEELLKKPAGLEGMQVGAIGRLCTHAKRAEAFGTFSFRDLFLPLGVPAGTPFVDHFTKALEKAGK